MPTILFVCTGNLYRSPLAAAFFRLLLDARGRADWSVSSAGTWTAPGQRVPPEGLRAASKFGADLLEHRSQIINAEMLSRANLVLVMEKGHKEALDLEFPSASGKVHLLSQVVDGLAYDIPDPMIVGGEVESLAGDLHKLLDKGFESICALAEKHRESTD